MRPHPWTTAWVVAALVLTGAVAPASATPYCGITWGSQPRNNLDGSGSRIVNVRGGQHDCYDRLVIDFEGKADNYGVSYVPEVYADGSGELVPLLGAAKLQIYVIGTAYDPETATFSYRPPDPRRLVDVTGWRTFRQVSFGGSFEGYTNLGVGVRARLPFRVLTLDGPGSGSRIVVDVAHRW